MSRPRKRSLLKLVGKIFFPYAEPWQQRKSANILLWLICLGCVIFGGLLYWAYKAKHQI